MCALVVGHRNSVRGHLSSHGKKLRASKLHEKPAPKELHGSVAAQQVYLLDFSVRAMAGDVAGKKGLRLCYTVYCTAVSYYYDPTIWELSELTVLTMGEIHAETGIIT